MLKRITIIVFLLAGFAWSFSASAATCPTDNGAGVGCNAGNNEYYCGNACRQLSAVTTPTLSHCQTTYQVCAPGVDCSNSYAAAYPCGVPQACNGGFTLCNIAGTGNPSFPDSKCKANASIPAGCSSYNQCTSVCSACSAGYELVAGSCTGATVKLGTNSVLSDRLVNSTAPLMSILSSGNVGIGITSPGVALDLVGAFRNSLATTHTLLAGTGNVVVMADNNGTLYTSTAASSLLWSGTVNGNIWNGAAGVGNVGIGTTAPGQKLTTVGSAWFHAATSGARQANLMLGEMSDGPTSPAYTWYTNDAVNNNLESYSNRWNSGWKFSRASLVADVTVALLQGNYNADANFSLYKAAGGVGVFLDSGSGASYINGGNLGIGAANPSAKLHIFDDTSNALKVGSTQVSIIGETDDAGYPGMKINPYNSSLHLGISAGADNSLFIWDNGTSYMQVKELGTYGLISENGTQPLALQMSGGNVGVALTAPTVRLDVSGAFRNSLATTHSLLAGSGNVVVLADNVGTLYSTPLTTFVNTNSLWGGTKNGAIYNGDAGVGNVGIGKTNPVVKLEVKGSIISADGSSTTNRNEGTYMWTDKGFGMELGYVGAWGTRLFTRSAAENISFGYQAGASTLQSQYVEWMRIVNGNVGIGTTNPNTKLQVLGEIRSGGLGANGTLYLDNATDGAGGATLSYVGASGLTISQTRGLASNILMNSSGIEFQTENSTAPYTKVTRMVVKHGDAGNVGIGTVAPGSKLQISTGNSSSYNPSSAGFSLRKNEEGYGLFAGVEPTGNGWLQAGTAGNGVYNLVFQGIGGNVGIGVINPSVKLDISGAIRNSLATTHNLLGAAGNVVVLADNTGTLYGTPIATFISNNIPTGLWGGTKNVAIYNGDAGAGSVGIGTTAPNTKLHVETNAGAVAFFKSTINGGLYAGYLGNGQTFSGEEFGLYNALNDARLAVYDQTNSLLLYGSSMVINSLGNVGIGTTNPAAVLDVSGAFRNSLATTHSLLAGTGNAVVLADNTGTLYSTPLDTFLATGLWGGTKNVAIYNGDAGAGNVGIGTIVPNTKLHVETSAGAVAFFKSTINGGFYAGYIGNGQTFSVEEFGLYNALNDARLAVYDQTNSLLLYGSSMVINSLGNVGIGTTNPAVGLDMSGAFRNSLATTHSLLAGTGNAVVLADNTGTLYSTPLDTFLSGATGLWGGTKNVAIYNGDAGAGNVGIGTIVPNTKLHVETSAGAVAFFKSTINGGFYAGYIGNGQTFSVEEFGLYNALNDARLAVYDQTNSLLLYGSSMVINSLGNVGIGTTNPQKTLDVIGDINASVTVNATSLCIAGVCKTGWDASNFPFVPLAGNVTLTGPLTIPGLNLTSTLALGNNNITGVNKLTVNVIDPLYSINGKKYSTYAASISGGVKEEYVGKTNITSQNKITGEFEKTIDFANVKEGSDLWVWRKVVEFNKDSVEVLVTPYGKTAQVYYLISDNKLIFRSDNPVEISYRLIAKRFDSNKWPTLATDQTEETSLIIND